MTGAQTVCSDIYRLLWAFHDGSLSSADAAQLRFLLGDDPCVREMFVCYAFVRGSFEWNYAAYRDPTARLDPSENGESHEQEADCPDFSRTVGHVRLEANPEALRRPRERR
jgi:hypothetical protein